MRPTALLKDPVSPGSPMCGTCRMGWTIVCLISIPIGGILPPGTPGGSAEGAVDPTNPIHRHPGRGATTYANTEGQHRTQRRSDCVATGPLNG